MITKEYICSLQDHSLLGHCCPDYMVRQYAQEVLDYGFRSLVAVSYTHLDVYKRQHSYSSLPQVAV